MVLRSCLLKAVIVVVAVECECVIVDKFVVITTSMQTVIKIDSLINLPKVKLASLRLLKSGSFGLVVLT